MWRIKVILLILVGIALECSAMSMQEAIDLFAGSGAMRHASLGICVMDIATGEVAGSYNMNQAQITASTMKNVTSIAALQLLGKDFKYKTRVLAVGEVDKKGTLHGNLIIKGSGDPTLGSRYFGGRSEFVGVVLDSLRKKGVEKIKGSIIADSSIFPYETVNRQWQLEDLGCDYGTGSWGLNFADNVVCVSFDRSGSEFADFAITPNAESLNVYNKMRIADVKNSNINANINYETGSLWLRGTVKRSDKRFSEYFSNPVPTQLLIDSLTRTLHAADIKINNKKIEDDELTDTIEVLSYESPVLSDVLSSLLHRSDNMYAESVLKAIAAYAGGSNEAPEDVVVDYWKTKGVDAGSLFMCDGSGLARNDKASARFLCEILADVEREKDSIGLSYAQLLPIAGENGTVRSFLNNTELDGMVALKSGSMSNVQCYAGYYPNDKPQYSVAVLVNNYGCTRRELNKDIETLFLNIFSHLSTKSAKIL